MSSYHKDRENSYKRSKYSKDDKNKRTKYIDEYQPKSKNKIGQKDSKPSVIEKEKVNFSTSGKLAQDTNTFNNVVIVYNQPPEAANPTEKWRLYPFKGDEALSYIEISKQSAYLLGRDRRVVDIPIDHPSCSKQHAVIQFRSFTKTNESNVSKKIVKPYLIDLESANCTFLNNNKIEVKKYYQLFDKDVIKFGFSSREYVLMKLNEEIKKVESESENDEE